MQRKIDDARLHPLILRGATNIHAVKIATWNINGVRGRLQLLLKWLAKAKPGVLALQELKCPDALFPEAELREAGYDVVWAGERACNGLALLARKTDAVVIRKALPEDAYDKASRYLETAVDGVPFARLYLPNGDPHPRPRVDYKLEWFDRLIAHTHTLKKLGAPVLLRGDFNVVPTNADIYATTSWDDNALLQPESRAAYRKLLKQGWTDSIRRLHPDETISTFRDYFQRRWKRNAAVRIDHILLSPSIAQRLKSAGVDMWTRGELKSNDHSPVWVELSDPKTQGVRTPPAKAKPRKRAPTRK